MQNYQAEQPVSAAGALAAATDAEGNIVVFTVSTGGNVVCLRPDQGGGAGWSQTATGLQGSQISVGLTQSGALLLATPNAEVVRVVEQTATGWSAPQNIPLPTENFNGSDPLDVCVRNVGGQLYVTYFQQGNVPATQPGGPYAGTICVWDDSGKTLTNPFMVPLLDAFSLQPGVNAQGNLGFFSVATPQVYSALSNNYQTTKIYSDKGSKSQNHVAFWRLNSSGGFSSVGDFAASGADYNYAPPTTASLSVQQSLDWSGTIADPLYVASPTDPAVKFVSVWNSNGFGSSAQGSIWYPVRSDGEYLPLGYVSNPTTSDPSSLPSVVMVRKDLALPATIYKKDPNRVSDWPEAENDLLLYGSWGAKGTPLALDAISPDAGGVAAATFYAHADFNVPAGPAYCLAQTTAVQSIVVCFDPKNPDIDSNGAAVGTPTAQAIVASSTADDSNGVTQFFAVLSGGGLYVLDQASATWISLDQSRNYQSLAASLDASGLLEVFAIDSGRALYHVRQDSAAPNGWGTVVEVDGTQQYAQLSVTRDGQGNSHAFLTTAAGGLFWVIQDPSTTLWTISEVELNDLDTVQDVRTFTTEITVTDANLIFQPNSPATIWSDDLVSASVNGAGVILDRQPVNFNTDLTGKLTVTVQTTNLVAPVLYVSTPAMAQGESVAIQPNASIQATLQTVDAQTLISELGISQSNADAVAAAVNNAMSLAQQPSSGGGAATRYISRNRDLRGITYRADSAQPSPGRIDPSRLPEQHWRVEARDGKVSFQVLTAAEARSWRARQQATLPRADSWPSWFGDLGDLVESVFEGVVSAFTYTISVISTGIEAALTFMINGVEYVWNFTVDLVEQAFAIVEAIFAAVGVAFDSLVSWLGFLFDWQDILRTKAAVAWSIQQTLPLMTNVVSLIQQYAVSGITTLKSQLQSSVQTVLNALGPNQSIAALNGQYATQPAPFDGAAGTNIVLNGFIANAGAATLPSALQSGAAAGSVPDPVSNLVNLLQAQVAPNGQFVQSVGFANASTYFSQIAAQPDQLVQLTFAGLLSALEGVAEAALDLAQSVVDEICAAIGTLVDWFLQLLTEPLNIPFVSTLYETYISPGNPLTAMDLFSLMVAIPLTVAYKLGQGTAPFATDADLAAFTGSYTTAWLQQVTGLGGAGMGAVRLEGPAPTFMQQFWAFGGAAATGLYMVVEVNLDWFPCEGLPGAASPPVVAGIAAIFLEGLQWAFACPYVNPANTALPGCGSAMAVGNLLWATMGFLPFLMDSGVFVATLKVKTGTTVARNWGTAGIFIDFVVGIVSSVGTCVSLGLTGMSPGLIVGTALNAALSTVKVVRSYPITSAVSNLFVPPNLEAATVIDVLLAVTTDALGDLIGTIVAFTIAQNMTQAADEVRALPSHA
jgi:hypothetical protein